MKKNTTKKLSLNRESVRRLDQQELKHAAGGFRTLSCG
jgi:natural product precursor